MANLNLDIASKCDITYRRGNTFRVNILRTGFNFSGYSAKMQIKDEITKEVLETFNSGTEITLSTGTIAIDAGVLSLGNIPLIYDLQLTSGGGVVETWLYGRLFEVEDITT